MLCRTVSFSVSSPLSVCSFVHGFLLLTLFTVVPNTFMIIGGKAFFCFDFWSFCSSFSSAKSCEEQHTRLCRGLPFHALLLMFKIFLSKVDQNIFASKDTRAHTSYGEGKFFFSVVCCKMHLPPVFSRNTGKHFFILNETSCCGFHPAVFRTVYLNWSEHVRKEFAKSSNTHWGGDLYIPADVSFVLTGLQPPTQW